jgi:hypothetical protein
MALLAKNSGKKYHVAKLFKKHGCTYSVEFNTRTKEAVFYRTGGTIEGKTFCKTRTEAEKIFDKWQETNFLSLEI